MIIDWKALHKYLASKCSPESIGPMPVHEDVVAFSWFWHKISAYLGWESNPDKIDKYRELYMYRVKVINNILAGLYLLAGGGSPSRYIEILRQQWFILYDPKTKADLKQDLA